jgi:signal peptidase I
VAIPAKVREKLEAELSARRSDAQQRASRRLYWQELLTSLWAPFTCFALALILYIFLVESYTAAYHWAQPALKLFGLLMIGWFVGLWTARLLFTQFRQMRKLRHEARELSQDIEAAMNTPGENLEPKTRDRLIEQAAVLDSQRIEGDAGRLESEIKKLSSLADKHLAGWRRGSSLEVGIGFVKALAIALLIRTIVVEPFKIPSGSMYPTLQVGDQIFVNKFIYGVRIPWLNKVPFVIVRPPERGDVIVFNNPLNESVDFIKRVVGVPGDKVELFEGVIYINGKAQPRKLISDHFTYYTQDNNDPNGTWRKERVELYEENLGGKVHRIFEVRDRTKAHEGPWIVPAGHVFVMGDNRENSADSRLGFGVNPLQVAFVPYGNIKGKAMIIWLSLSYDGFMSSLFGGTGLRTDRLFLPIR